MALKIETFTNLDGRTGWRPGNNFGGQSLFKALGHPRTMAQGKALAAKLGSYASFAIYDPEPQPVAEHFDAFFPIPRSNLKAVLVQRMEDLGQKRFGLETQPVLQLAGLGIEALFIAAFDADNMRKQIERLLPAGCAVLTLDDMRLPKEWLGNPARYLDPINFATNFAFLRDVAGDRDSGLHTKVVTANYWRGYGAQDPEMWCCLFDADGRVLADWLQPMGGVNHSVVIDSRDVRRRFGLGDFAGSLFLHAVRAKGHDVVKYALDCFSESGAQLSCSHDANAWPADLYAGVPAPGPDEDLILWVQNSHPVTIPAGAVGANPMGSQDVAWFDAEVPPFGTRAVDLGKLLPNLKFPDQIEIQAGRYFVRPRYEVVKKAASPLAGKRRIAHANVERTDLKPDPQLPKLGAVMGKGYIMPLPVLPVAEFRSTTIPTPMSTAQTNLPLKAVLVDGSGRVVGEKFLGKLDRRQSVATNVDAWLADMGAALPSGYGHVEYLYDFREGGEGDGWLHALGCYEMRTSGHLAETIFGAHIYNTPVTYRDEPQSYTHRPPGLTTRLFLRMGDLPLDTLCHLVYPASVPQEVYGQPHSQTVLTLHNARAELVATRELKIPHGGSVFWRVSEVFGAEAHAAAGPGAYVIIRDVTCRLFGFHGMQNGRTSFCLDHMFGF